MRVLFASVYPHLPTIVGGLQTTTDNLCLAMRDMGVQVAVLCGTSEHPGSEPAPPAQRDETLGYLAIRALDPVGELPRVIADWQPDIVVVQTGSTLLPLLLTTLESQVPVAVYLHNVEVHQLGGHFGPDPRILYIANSDFTARRWNVLAGIHCVVVPPVVLPERYLVASSGDKVLFVNPVPIKGVEIAFAIAQACPEIPFLVMESWGLDPVWRLHCLQRISHLPNITWESPKADMRPVFAQTRTLLMPSIWEEAFGRTALEAQISGIPVVASKRGALPNTVGQGGILLDINAPMMDWADALRRAYQPSSEYEDLSQAARVNAYQFAPSLEVGRLLSHLAAHVCR
jgi:glycosyltransferase involved in cell wall biosynthesis